MTPDPQTVAALGAVIVSICGVFKFLIPAGPNQDNYVRLLSALVGTAVYILADVAVPHAHITLATAASILLPSAAQGFTTGSGATVAVKTFHMAQDAVNKPAPAEPAPPTA
jgi:hypothetical protein